MFQLNKHDNIKLKSLRSLISTLNKFSFTRQNKLLYIFFYEIFCIILPKSQETFTCSKSTKAVILTGTFLFSHFLTNSDCSLCLDFKSNYKVLDIELLFYCFCDNSLTKRKVMSKGSVVSHSSLFCNHPSSFDRFSRLTGVKLGKFWKKFYQIWKINHISKNGKTRFIPL